MSSADPFPPVHFPPPRSNEKSRDPRLEYESRSLPSPPNPGVTNRCFRFTISRCQRCIHACINEIFDSIWREIGFHILRGNPFFALLLRSSVILGECTMSCALLFPVLVSVLLFFSFLLLVSLSFIPRWNYTRNLFQNVCFARSSWCSLSECIIKVYCYCLSKQRVFRIRTVESMIAPNKFRMFEFEEAFLLSSNINCLQNSPRLITQSIIN